jgi:regulator of protease activity HflC (stomatin/prohibitin superfamily)
MLSRIFKRNISNDTISNISNGAKLLSRVLQESQEPRLQNRSLDKFESKEEKQIYTWPISKINTILNICAEKDLYIIERFGKYNRTAKSGIFFAIPFVDKIKYRICLMEQTLRIDPQHAFTKDNVSVSISGNVFLKFIDASSAAYGSTNPLMSVNIHAQSAMRNCVGNMELDEVLKERSKMNLHILDAIKPSAANWGLDVLRYEITDIDTDKQIRESMDKQVSAERNRRETVLNAEGEKRAIELKAEALASSLKIVSDAIKINPYATIALQTQIAEKLINMNAEIGKQSNTIFFQKEPADINSLMVQAKTIMNTQFCTQNFEQK